MSPSVNDVLGHGAAPGSGPIPWSYECSICHERFHPSDMSHHVQVERGKPTWPGMMNWSRVDEPVPSRRRGG